MGDVSVQLAKLILEIPKRVFNNDYNEFFKKHNISSDFLNRCCTVGMNEIESYMPPLMRPDVIFTSQFEPKFIEFNISSAIGSLTDMHITSHQFSHIDEGENSFFESPLDGLYNYIQSLEIEQEKIRFAICEWGEENPRYFLEMASYLNKKGIEAFFCKPKDLKVNDNGIYLGESKIDYIMWGFCFDEVESRFQEIEHIIEAAKDKKVKVIGDFIEEIFCDKTLLLYLSDERFEDAYTSEEWDLCKTYIPWTRMLEPRSTSYQNKNIDLIQFVKENKNSLILKPKDLYGGRGIYVGADMSYDDWQEIVEKAVYSKEYIVQEYYETPQFELMWYKDRNLILEKSKIVLGPFIIGEQIAGCSVRASTITSGNVINIKNGASHLHTVITKEV